MKTHKDLKIWKDSIELVKSVYDVVKIFPREELYNLGSEMKKTVISIPSNIAEGAARQSKKELLRFLYVSLGSLSELETQCIIAKELNFLKDDKLMEDIESLRRLFY